MKTDKLTFFLQLFKSYESFTEIVEKAIKKKSLLHLILIVIGLLISQNIYSQIYSYPSRFFPETEGTVRIRLSNENAGDNTFYPDKDISYGITMTKSNNLVDRTGHWEFMCLGKRRGVAYIQGWQNDLNKWAPSVGLDVGYAYIARAQNGFYYDYKNNRHNSYNYIYIYCDSFEGGINGVVIEYTKDMHSHFAVSPEIFEEGFQVYDPVIANFFLDIADLNEDGMISREERFSVKRMAFLDQERNNHLQDGNTYFQYFPNVNWIGVGRYEDYGFGFISDKIIIENPNVDTINIGYYNEIKHIDLSGCPKLKEVYISDVSCVDFVLPTSVESICIYGNDFEYLDLSSFENLSYIQIKKSKFRRLVLPASANDVICQHGQLSTIDLSRCENLKYLDLRDNNLISLDVSHCINLERLIVSKNKLTELNTKNCGSSLLELTCWSNPIKSLDVSHHEFLSTLYCGGCDFEEIDISANKFIVWLELNVKGHDSTIKKVYLPSDHVYKGKYYVGDFDHPTDFDGIQIVYR